MNRIDQLFKEKNNNILSIYFTAGYPKKDSTADIIRILDTAGVDIIEIGVPFSDPVADGPVIQQSSQKALENGMNLKLLFNQLKDIRKEVKIPLLLMGYLNPVMQFGMEEFCEICSQTGIDGTILPDLPPEIFKEQYKPFYDKNNLRNILLATPQTSDERYRHLDTESTGFLYMVSALSTTGSRKNFEEYQIEYFKRIRNLNLKLPRLVGFGISSHETFRTACNYANGAIIGSAFIKLLEKEGNMEQNIREFIGLIKG